MLLDIPLCITVCFAKTPNASYWIMLMRLIAISEGHGDIALLLLKAGAETDRKDVDGYLAIDLAPDLKVCKHSLGFSKPSG